MLLKNSIANQEAVQAKTAGKKKSSRASGQEEEKKLQCVCECVVFIPPLSRSLSICVLQSWGIFEWVSGCVYVAEFPGVQSKGVSRVLCYTPDFNLKLEIREK